MSFATFFVSYNTHHGRSLLRHAARVVVGTASSRGPKPGSDVIGIVMPTGLIVTQLKLNVIPL